MKYFKVFSNAFQNIYLRIVSFHVKLMQFNLNTFQARIFKTLTEFWISDLGNIFWWKSGVEKYHIQAYLPIKITVWKYTTYFYTKLYKYKNKGIIWIAFKNIMQYDKASAANQQVRISNPPGLNAFYGQILYNLKISKGNNIPILNMMHVLSFTLSSQGVL